MRQAILDGISALSLGTFTVSNELPWDASGQPLYEKNIKTFYVDEPQTEESTLINTLGAEGSLATRITTISVFVTVDAKQKPSNYDSLKTAVSAVKNTTDITAVRSREVDSTTSFTADTMTTEFIFRFTEMKIN